MKKAPFLFIVPILFLMGAKMASAGFGISPPYVKNASLIRNSSYEQVIVLSRSDSADDLNVNVSIDVPGADDWVSIDRGTSFVMHQGESQLPMRVTMTVPDKAKFGNYKGNLRVVITPLGGPEKGTVGIAIGAQIDVDVTVIDKKIFDFDVRGVKVEPLETGHRWWIFFFPGKIRFTMQVENTGNVPFAPTKVVFAIKDASGQEVLETTENIGKLEKVNPFQIKGVLAELPTRLSPGSYRANFKIYNHETLEQAGELNLNILPYGAIPGYEGFGFWGLTRNEQMIIAGIGLGILLALSLLMWGIWRLIRRKKGAVLS